VRPWGARFLVPLLVAELSGCLAVRTTRESSATPEAGVAVVVFADDAARRAARPGPEGVLGELERREHGRWQPVFRSLAPRWAVTGLPPGTYRLRFPARLDEAGNIVPLPEKPRKLKLAGGELVKVEAVLEHVPVALVVAGVVVVAVAAIALSKWAKEHELPEPPLPPPELVDLAFHLTLDLAAGPWPAPDRAAPLVTSHFPAAGAQVPPGKVRVIFAFSEPLDPHSLDPGKVRVLGERSGLVPGLASYDAAHWWVVWEAREQLSREKLHVTLDRGAVEDLAGNELASAASFAFWVR